jgi:BASS family bile acid:Na+ symporter
MHKALRLLRNRNFILFLALSLGLLWGDAARWTEKVALPALALVMTLSTTGISGRTLRSPRTLLIPVVGGVAMNYAVLGVFLLVLSTFLIQDESLRNGFILLAAVPPAVAVIPFTGFLNGNSTYSLVGTIGCYLGALVIMPLMALGFLGSTSIEPVKLFIIMVELIITPLVLSRILVRTGMASRIESVKGLITNWSFFLVSYTIVGLNRAIFLGQPLSLIPVALIAFASTFLLGFAIEKLAGMLRIESETITSLVLLGTLKNYGLAGGLALALFSKRTAVPATVSVIFMIVYIIWLGFKRR